MDTIRLTRDLRSAGYEHAELAQMCAAGQLRHLRRGAYGLGPAPTADRERHIELILATTRLLTRDDGVVSHMSAAALHGLPLWAAQLEKVHLTCARESGGKQRGTNFVHVSPLRVDETVTIHGVLVTSLARTVLDLARNLSSFRAVAIGDAALRQGLTPEDLSQALIRHRGWPGMVRARRTVAFLDGRSESVGESCSRLRMAELGLPVPELQLEIRDDAGLLIARPDFSWLSRNTVGEYDGRGKYGVLRAPGRTVEDVVLAEKGRDDALRARGLEVVRWGWESVTNPAELEQKIRLGFRQAARRQGS